MAGNDAFATAASLGKFGDVPVSLYTGVPDISIPLFTAQGKTLALPIVLITPPASRSKKPGAGTERITRMKYPADYALATSGAEGLALNAMRATAHIHYAVIERWVIEKVGGIEKVVGATLTTFKQYAAGQYLPYQRFVLNSPSPVQ